MLQELLAALCVVESMVECLVTFFRALPDFLGKVAQPFQDLARPGEKDLDPVPQAE